MKYSYCLIFAALAFITSLGYGNGPCSAISVPNNGVLFTTYNLTGQSPSGVPAPPCGTYNDPDIWFSFVAPAGGTVTIEVKGITAADPAMAIYTGGCAAPDLIGCFEDQYCGTVPNPGVSLTTLTPGATYYIRVWNEDPGGGTFKIRILNPNAPNFTNTYNAYNTSPNCVQLTSAGPSERGCSWYNAPLDFDDPFELEFNLFFGSNDAGADGICLVFSTSQACGVVGGGIGAQGIPNSLIIEFDTWDNGTTGYDDIPPDHTSIHINGDFTYSIEGPVALPNLEDGQSHAASIIWNPGAQTLTVSLDGATVLTLAGFDIITNCFGGQTEVFWGWTASTGAAYNQQSFCYESAIIDNTSPINEELFIELCDGETYTTPNGNILTSDGDYNEQFVASNGCLSTRIIHLDYYPVELKFINDTICGGESVTYEGMSYSTPGDYNFMISGNPCDTIANLHLEVIDFSVDIYKINDIDCNNPFGIIQANVTDMSSFPFTGSYEYIWSTPDGNIVSGQGTPQLTVDQSGNYSVIVRTQSGQQCTFVSAFVQVFNNSSPPNAIISTNETLDCNHPSIVLDGNSSFPGALQYQWFTNDGNIVGSDIGSVIVINQAGTYFLAIEDILTGCKDTTSYQVINNQFNVTATLTKMADLDCLNQATTLEATISDTGNYNFEWTTADGHIISNEDSTVVLIDKAGKYTFTISNNQGCSIQYSINVSQDTSRPVIYAGKDSILNCYHSQLTYTGIITTPLSNYSIKWQSEDHQINADTSTITINQLGTYILTVTDTLNHCETRDTLIIGESFKMPAVTNIPIENLTCNDKQVDLLVHSTESGTDYTYEWTSNNPNFTGNINDSLVTVNDTGFYYVKVLDLVNGCTTDLTFRVNGSTDQPIANAGADATLDCISPFITHSGTFTSTQNNFISVTWSTNNGSINGPINQLTTSFESAGFYVLTVTNSLNNCSDTDTMQVFNNNDKPIISIDPTDTLTCSTTSITVVPHWSNSGISPIIEWITMDGNLVSASTDSIAVVDKAGTYQISVKNQQNGCISTLNITVIEEKKIPAGNITPPDTLDCQKTETILTFNNNDPAFLFLWSTTNGTLVGATDTNEAVAGKEGTYTLQIIDNRNGCQLNLIQDVIANRVLPIANAGNDLSLNCFNPQISLQGETGNSGSLEITWSVLGSSGNIVNGEKTLTPLVDLAGTFIMTILNTENGCKNADTVEVINKITQPAFVNPTIIDANCLGKNGKISFENIASGDGPYQFWLNGNLVNPTNNQFTGLSSGTYHIEGQDSNGCKFEFTGNIKNGENIAFDLPDTVTLNYGESFDIEPIFFFDTVGMSYENWIGGNFFSCNPCLYPTISPTQNSILTLTVADRDGCKATESMVVRVLRKKAHIFVPNAFSPGDYNGINDKVTVYTDESVIKEIQEFRIFNRWGAEMFYRNNFAPNDEALGWDGYFQGKMCNPNVFVYFARCRDIYGQEITVKGSITLTQ